jgi:hypothetical protein
VPRPGLLSVCGEREVLSAYVTGDESGDPLGAVGLEVVWSSQEKAPTGA